MTYDISELREKLIELGFERIQHELADLDIFSAHTEIKSDAGPAAETVSVPILDKDQPCFMTVDVTALRKGLIITFAWTGEEQWQHIGEAVDLEPLGFVDMLKILSAHQ